MCRSCADFSSSGRSTRRCSGFNPAGAAAAARSNHAVKVIEREVPEVPEPEPLPVEPSLNVARLQQLIYDALDDDDYDPETRSDALAEIKETYGSVDLAVAAVGATIQARAEEIAGITGDEIKTAHDRRIVETAERYEAAKAALAASTKNGQPVAPLLEELDAASDAHKAAKAGTDPETAEDMQRLIEGRLAALTEMQSMGGTHTFAKESNPEIVEAINAATRCYPSSWISISNSGQEIVATATHKSEGFYSISEKRGVSETSRRVDTAVFAPQDAPVNPDPWGDFVPTGEKWPDGREVYSREFWQVATSHMPCDAEGKPTSDEPWEQWTHPTTGEVIWRYPAMQKRTVGSKAVSEIQIGPSNPSNVAGMEKFHPIAVHEQAHRFERVINNIEDLEVMFLTRRTTLPDGRLEKSQRYSSNTQVRPDHFSEKYTGRSRYTTGLTEVFSTGMEGVFAGQYGGFIGIGGRLPDTEMQNFVLGLLVTCDGKRGDC